MEELSDVSPHTRYSLKTRVRAEFVNVHISPGAPVGAPHVSLGPMLARLDTVIQPLKTLM